jgi:hypothetical protein
LETESRTSPLPPHSGAARPDGGQRYLILTYLAAFDRVHYPLQLHRAEPTREELLAKIRELRAESGGGGGAGCVAFFYF